MTTKQNDFSFLAKAPPYNYSARAIKRLERRHELLIDPFREEIAGARILDLGAHDGRWAYALARAGAAEVIGIEARQNLIDSFAEFPDAPWKSRVKLLQGDMFSMVERLADAGEKFDLIAVYGVFYHMMDHLRLLELLHRLEPQAIFIDSEFSLRRGAVIDMVFERTDFKVNAAPQIQGQERAIIGIPTPKAMNFMARALGYSVYWTDAQVIFGDDHAGVEDYFRIKVKRRRFCFLLPNTPEDEDIVDEFDFVKEELV
jgi:2-polyprenyl-3-methyl-5-hydroxy-6-metoxy-1,4-benzoquinol methylase